MAAVDPLQIILANSTCGKPAFLCEGRRSPAKYTPRIVYRQRIHRYQQMY